jgi:predicted TIM-barrel fold metal-dependent hydrolase
MPALYDPAERIRAQDADSVDAEVLYSFPGLWDAIKESGDHELERACALVYNDWISEFVSHAPDRLVGLGRIPATGVDGGVLEARRCVEELGLRGLVLDGWPSGASVGGSPDDEPFWSAVDELEVPVSIHHGFGAAAVTSPSAGIAPGLKPQMADVPLPMVAAGVFDRHPNLRVVLAHGDAGWAFHWLEFLDINYVRQRHLDLYQLEDPDALPSEYIRRHCWFTFSDDRSAVRNRHKIGAAHLMWATHFPLDTADWPDDRQHAVQLTGELPADERDPLLATNAARLYKLPGYEEGFPAAELGAFEQLVHF